MGDYILLWENPNIKQTDLIKQFNQLYKVIIPPTTMSGILSLASRNKILKIDNVYVLNERILDCMFPELERIFFQWHNQTFNKGVCINVEILIEKAKDFGNMMGINDGNSFNYSEWWIKLFKERYHLKRHQICGESERVTKKVFLNANNDARNFISLI